MPAKMYVDEEFDGIVHECSCGEAIHEDTDTFGEVTTTNYADHVKKYHPERIVKI